MAHTRASGSRLESKLQNKAAGVSKMLRLIHHKQLLGDQEIYSL